MDCKSLACHSRTGMLLLLTLLLTGTGCTAQSAFEGSKQNRKNECEKYVSNKDYLACMESANMTYGEYQDLQEENRHDPE